MDIVIYGAGIWGRKAIRRVKEYYTGDINVKGVIDKSFTGKVDGVEIVQYDTLQHDTIIVICIAARSIVADVAIELRELGFERLYLFLGKDNPVYKSDVKFLEYECVRIDSGRNDLIPHVEIHAADDCNLNCRGCVHFSPLFKKEKGIKLSDILHNVSKISEISNNILSFYILGGEPFLNSELNILAVEIRRMLPKTDVEIVTNGLKLLECDEKLLEVISDNRIIISISVYKPTNLLIDQILERLINNKVDYIVRPYDTKQKFIKPLAESTDSKYPKTCTSNGCINIGKGKVARCPVLMYIHKVNEVFGKNYPEHGIYQIEEFKSAKSLNCAMKEPVPLCQYCVNVEIPWSPCKKEIDESDFITKG